MISRLIDDYTYDVVIVKQTDKRYIDRTLERECSQGVIVEATNNDKTVYVMFKCNSGLVMASEIISRFTTYLIRNGIPFEYIFDRDYATSVLESKLIATEVNQ